MSLLAQTVSLSVEGRMIEKRMKTALEQATSMMVAVSHFPFREILLVFSSVMSLLIVFSLFNTGRYGDCFGSLRLLEAPRPG